MKTIRKGQKNQLVTRLQMLLNQNLKPSPNLKPDGDFGNKTYEVVIQFQKLKNLSPDGIVGNKTWDALGQNISKIVAENIALNVITPWHDIAKAELGIRENSKTNKHNARIIEYHATTTLKAKTDEVPWCSSFVNWVMTQSSYKGTNNALAKSWLDWGLKVIAPVQGDIVVIKKKTKGSDKSTGTSTGYHVAFFDSKSATHIRLLGGNQQDSVKYSTFNLSRYEVKGYRRPITRVLNVPVFNSSFVNRVLVA
ncbi:MAG: TIGR02594 family protein [Gammaproteobacteria bacterium]|nr:TIGR02594 family protein [Gammaproteobacteria bacterium]MCW9031894.1 TIGR02594 family protein [Gammaproteobacteria bacterium]